MCSERRRQRWLNHTRHLGGAWQAASALGSTLLLLEKVAQPLGRSPWAAGLGTWTGAPWAGGRSSSVSCQHPFGLRLRAAGWERLTAWNCPRALVWGHKTPQDQRLHPFSSVTSCPRVEAKLLLWMSLAFFWLRSAPGHSWCLGITPYASLARTASQYVSMHWTDNKSHYFWKRELFCMC